MFTASERSMLRDQLIERAAADPLVVGAALVGSAARHAEDAWSDIDLALQLAPRADERRVVDDWTEAVSQAGGGTSDVLDVYSAGVRYRVFLLRSSLQVDLSFCPHEKFRGSGEPFHVLFGEPAEPTEPIPVDVDRVIGMGWLYALHARSAVARSRVWQASGMLDELRGCLITLQCTRLGLESWHGRGVDKLPDAELDDLHRSHPASITRTELDLSRRALTASFMTEIGRHDQQRADRLAEPFRDLTRAVAD